MLVQKEVRFGSTEHYPIVFGSYALRLIEKETGYTLDRLGLLMMTGRVGISIMITLLYAALENGRIRAKLTRKPFDIEEVCALIDEEGGAATVFAPEDDGMKTEDDGTKVRVREPRAAHPISIAIQECWDSAFPTQKRIEPESKENPTIAAVP